VTGWFAISLRALREGDVFHQSYPENAFDWLSPYRPVQRIGKTILLYYIPESGDSRLRPWRTRDFGELGLHGCAVLLKRDFAPEDARGGRRSRRRACVDGAGRKFGVTESQNLEGKIQPLA
jgi:hypothetical protein